MRRREMLRTTSALLLGNNWLLTANSYEAQIAEWRKNYDRDLRSAKGPLWLIGRYPVPEGKSEIGSDPSVRVSLPSRAPRKTGTLERYGGNIAFEPAPGIAVKVNGKPASGKIPLHLAEASRPGDKLQFGDFEIVLSEVGGEYQLTVRDERSVYSQQFQGPLWFPVNPSYRVEGAFTAYPQPKGLKVPDTSGRTRTRIAPGDVAFRVNGKPMRLEPIAIDGLLFFMFKDGTCGHETYGAGRFLDTEPAKNSKVLLDFNKAYNPYCAFNPYSSCPIPQKYNTLAMRVEAGEKYRSEH